MDLTKVPPNWAGDQGDQNFNASTTQVSRNDEPREFTSGKTI